MPVKQDQEEREWIEAHIPKSLCPEELQCWKVICARFGPKVNRENLVTLARAFVDTIHHETQPDSPSPLKCQLSRNVIRRKKCLLWWFQENWEIIEPWLDRIVLDV
jgi:hypothetical protein